MTVDIPVIALGFVVLLAVGLALWLLSSSSSASERRKMDAESRNLARQPWDAESADGRGNR